MKGKVGGGWKPTNLTSVFNIRINAISIVPSDGKMDIHRANADVGWVGFHPLKSLSMDRRCNNDVHLCVDSFGFGWGLWSWGVVLFPLEHQSRITLITVFKGTVKMQNRKSFAMAYTIKLLGS